MRAKDKFLEKTKLIILILCFSQNLYAGDLYEKIFIYNDELKNSSANFIQTNTNHVQEGTIFFGDERIKISVLIFSKNLSFARIICLRN